MMRALLCSTVFFFVFLLTSSDSAPTCTPSVPTAGQQFAESIEAAIDEGVVDILGMIVKKRCRLWRNINGTKLNDFAEKLGEMADKVRDVCITYNKACNLFPQGEHGLQFCNDASPLYFNLLDRAKLSNNDTKKLAVVVEGFLTAMKISIAYPKLVLSVAEHGSCSSQNLTLVQDIKEAGKNVSLLVHELYCLIKELVRGDSLKFPDMSLITGLRVDSEIFRRDDEAEVSGDCVLNKFNVKRGKEDEALAVNIIRSLALALDWMQSSMTF